MIDATNSKRSAISIPRLSKACYVSAPDLSVQRHAWKLVKGDVQKLSPSDHMFQLMSGTSVQLRAHQLEQMKGRAVSSAADRKLHPKNQMKSPRLLL